MADVFSGVSLVFEKAFQVGDIVDIDGLVRGTVQELGVRTIKLIGDDNNLKIVRYSDGLFWLPLFWVCASMIMTK